MKVVFNSHTKWLRTTAVMHEKKVHVNTKSIVVVLRYFFPSSKKVTPTPLIDSHGSISFHRGGLADKLSVPRLCPGTPNWDPPVKYLVKHLWDTNPQDQPLKLVTHPCDETVEQTPLIV